MDLVRDSDEEDHDQGEEEDLSYAKKDSILNTDAEGQDAGYTDEDVGAIVMY